MFDSVKPGIVSRYYITNIIEFIRLWWAIYPSFLPGEVYNVVGTNVVFLSSPIMLAYVNSARFLFSLSYNLVSPHIYST
ncbi:MAG: hypothetical protein OQK64_10970 [Ignavibacteriaceae bacterium]|nr:hypothetical protein [Ignavibacteriaceae bacterium]MCW9066016.1 hypothetical protein [Ignavibacteriaceae bacterium]MCW9094522.1 hypothetical protein [Ignavibacteriaceae bacterium]